MITFRHPNNDMNVNIPLLASKEARKAITFHRYQRKVAKVLPIYS